MTKCHCWLVRVVSLDGTLAKRWIPRCDTTGPRRRGIPTLHCQEESIKGKNKGWPTNAHDVEPNRTDKGVLKDGWESTSEQNCKPLALFETRDRGSVTAWTKQLIGFEFVLSINM